MSNLLKELSKMTTVSTKDALKGKKVRVYARVSTEEQEGTLPDQLKTVEAGLKRLGSTTKAVVYQEQGSGTKKDREQLQKMLQEIRESPNPEKNIVVVRDFQRFTRDPVHYGALWDEFRDLGVRILSINENMVTGTSTLPDPQADLLVPILIAAGGSEVNIRKVQTAQGVQRAREKGIFSGTPPELYRKEKIEPRREMIRLLRADVGQTEVSRRIGKSTSFVRKNRAKHSKIVELGGEELLNDYLDAIDLVRDFMNEKDEDVRGSRATVRMKTVARMVSGYLAEPFNEDFTKPTRADLEEYYNNFNDYKKK